MPDAKLLKTSAVNTLWCLGGCAIGDFGTILWFQLNAPDTPVPLVMGLAMLNGILTSILLETLILKKGGMSWREALKTASGMSVISMLAMELAMNATDYALTGGAIVTWWVLPPALFAGFCAALPYNYWRLKKYGKACH